MTDQQQPFPPDVNPAAAPVAPQTQTLGPGFSQTPEPTVEAGQEQVAPEHQGAPPQQQAQESLGISREEYEAIQAQLREKESLLAQIQQVAETQRQQQAERQYQEQLKGKLGTSLKKALERGDEDEVIQVAYDLINGEISTVTNRYQEQVQQYHQEVEQAFRAATLPGYAEHLIRTHNLPDDVKDDLLSLGNEAEMERYAVRVKGVLQQYQGQIAQQAIQQQGQQRRDAGVYAGAGLLGGATPSQPVQPGTAQELMPALRNILFPGQR